jgi:hypothetical protein
MGRLCGNSVRAWWEAAGADKTPPVIDARTSSTTRLVRVKPHGTSAAATIAMKPTTARATKSSAYLPTAHPQDCDDEEQGENLWSVESSLSLWSH